MRINRIAAISAFTALVAATTLTAQTPNRRMAGERGNMQQAQMQGRAGEVVVEVVPWP